MLPEIEKLLLIQHRDQNIRDLEKKIANIPLEEEDIRDRISEEKSAADTALANYQEVEIQIKNIELDVETRRDSVAKLKVQQYETKKNDEFQAMGEEIKRYESEITKLEDQEIELMEKAETLNTVLTEAKQILADSEESVDIDLDALRRTRANWEKQIAEEQEAREKAAVDVDPDLVENYERIFKAKNGNAVVGLIDMQCSGCHMKVIKATVVDVKAEKEIAYCENCGRMLYWWTDEKYLKTSNEY